MKDTMLQTVTPESVGIPSEAITGYLEYMKEQGVNLHSFLMMRHGKICAEGYCPPYSQNKLQRMYSSSKSFTSIAVGLMITEGKLSLDDKVADYFPEYLPENPHSYVMSMTIENLLKMATPFTVTNHHDKGGPWVKTFFNSKVTHRPGSAFLYATAAPHTLCALVEKLSGKPMLEYMKYKLSDTIGFSEDAYCIKGTDGYSWGGSGIMATLRDLAKLASLMMNGGRFAGKQLIYEDYVKRATSKQICNYISPLSIRKAGYGYQIWILPDGAFAFHGMGSQCAVCFPKQDFIFCCTADNQGSATGDYLIHEELYRRILHEIGEPMQENLKAQVALAEVCKGMKLKVQNGSNTSPIMAQINGTEYVLDENPTGIKRLSFKLYERGGSLFYERAGENKEIAFGFGENVEFIFPETHYYGEQIGVPSGKGYRAYGSAGWQDDNTLILYIQTLDDYLGTLTMLFSFTDDDISVLMSKAAEWFFDEYQGLFGGRKQ